MVVRYRCAWCGLLRLLVDAPAIGDVFRVVLFPSFDLEQYRADPSRFFVVGVNMTRTIFQAEALQSHLFWTS